MLINILRRLPSMGGSWYVEALRNDPEVIAEVLDAQDDEDGDLPAWAPPGVEWDQHAEMLGKIYDQLAAMVAILAAHPIGQGGRRPQIPKPHPRPERVIDGIRRQRALERSGDLDEEVEQAKARWRAAQESGETPPE